MSFESETRCCKLMLEQVWRILDETKGRSVLHPNRRTDAGRGVPTSDGLEIGAELLSTALSHSDMADALAQSDPERSIAKEIDARLWTLLFEMESRGVHVKKGARWKLP